ncbi:aminobutyraldehyde dehydrogenase [Pseudonocardia sp. NPDC049154]|uniref:aminobutyraldehyde dehydrogenase n=1 Tax=Pseudonocardia sp. NPDC049154 TaxID=3155501 RepID=UPI00340A7A3C
MQTFHNIVDGKPVPASDGRTTEIVDPSTGEVYATAPLSGQADVDAAYASAKRAYDEHWADITPSERQAALLRIADAVEANADELVELEHRDTGKPKALTHSEEIAVMVDQFRFFAGAARTLEGRASAEYMAGHTSSVRREPLGVVGAITPWNYPMMMATWKIGPALAGGNTMVLKPSDTTPASTTRMAELFAEFLPPGVLNVVCGDRSTGALISAHPIPALVAITGSTRAGKAVAAAAAPNVTRVHLELGGNAPVVVFADSDVAASAEDIAVAGFFNAGQDCTAATRVLAHESIAGDLAEALAEVARAVRFSSEEDDAGPDSEDLFIPPLNNAAQFEKVSGLLSRVPGHASVLAGGSPAGGPGFFFPATVVNGLRQDDELVREEIFGPVITVQTFTDEAEALHLANDTDYGLSSSVWTTDHSRAQRMSRGLDFGCVWLNCHIPLVAEMPHGGFKQSGYGKDLSGYSVEDYTRVKHVMTKYA